MPMHFIGGVVLHATVLAVIGYALLFSATRTAGVVALIGRILGIWLFVLAVLSVVAFFVLPRPDRMAWPPHGMFQHGPPGMHPWGPPPGMPPPPGANQPAPPLPIKP